MAGHYIDGHWLRHISSRTRTGLGGDVSFGDGHFHVQNHTLVVIAGNKQGTHKTDIKMDLMFTKPSKGCHTTNKMDLKKYLPLVVHLTGQKHHLIVNNRKLA